MTQRVVYVQHRVTEAPDLTGPHRFPSPSGIAWPARSGGSIVSFAGGLAALAVTGLTFFVAGNVPTDPTQLDPAVLALPGHVHVRPQLTSIDAGGLGPVAFADDTRVQLDGSRWTKVFVAGHVVDDWGRPVAGEAWSVTGSACVIFVDGHGGFTRQWSGLTDGAGAISSPGWQPTPRVDTVVTCPGRTTVTLTVGRGRTEVSRSRTFAVAESTATPSEITLDRPGIRQGPGMVRLSGHAAPGSAVTTTWTPIGSGDSPQAGPGAQAGADGRWSVDAQVDASTSFTAHTTHVAPKGPVRAVDSLPATAWVVGPDVPRQAGSGHPVPAPVPSWTTAAVETSPSTPAAVLQPSKPTIGQYAPTPGSVLSSDGYLDAAIGNVHPGSGSVRSVEITIHGKGGSKGDHRVVTVPVNWPDQADPGDQTTPDHYWGYWIDRLTTGRRYVFTVQVCNTYGKCATSDPYDFTPYGLPEAGILGGSLVGQRLILAWGPVITHSSPFINTFECSYSVRWTSRYGPVTLSGPIGLGEGHRTFVVQPATTYATSKTCTNGRIATTADWSIYTPPQRERAA